MADALSNMVTLILTVFIPLHITLETTYLSKDANAVSSFVQSSSMLQQQTQQGELTSLLLKYWSLFALIYIIIPQTPLNILLNIIPLKDFLLTAFNLLSTTELLIKFAKFIEEQKQFLSGFLKFLNNMNDPNKSKLEEFTKLYQSSFTNYYNEKYHTDIRDKNVVESYLFGAYTDSVVALTKRYAGMIPSTNIIQTCFDFIVLNIINMKLTISSYYNFADEHANIPSDASNGSGQSSYTDNHDQSTASGTGFQPGSFESTTNRGTEPYYNELNLINNIVNEVKNLFRHPPSVSKPDEPTEPSEPDLD